MADIRINALATTAASTASDDYIAIDGSANGTRKLNAYSPTFGGNLTVGGTVTATGNITSSGGAANLISVYRTTDGQYFKGGGGNAARSLTMTSAQTTAEGDTHIIDAPSGTGVLKFQTTSVDRLTIASNGNTTLSGNLTVSGTGNSSFGGNVVVANTVDGIGFWALSAIGGDHRFSLTRYDGVESGSALLSAFGGINFMYNATSSRTSGTVGMVLNNSGNVLIGTTTDSGNGKLQLATHTTSAGGIGFGATTSLYNDGTGILGLTRSDGGGTGGINIYSSSTLKARLTFSGSDAYLDAPTGQLIVRTNGYGTALTLDSSQNATFAGNVNVTGSVFLGETLNFQRGVDADSTGYINDSGYGGGYTRFRTTKIRNGKGADIATFDGATKDATFAGTVKVNNKGIVKSADNVNIDTSATTIFTLSGTGGASFCFVCGDNGSAGFADLVVTVGNGEAVTVISSATIYGSPAARTYTTSGTSLKLAMASGVMNVRTTAIYTA